MQVTSKFDVGNEVYLCLVNRPKGKKAFFNLIGPLVVQRVEIKASQALITNQDEKNPEPSISYHLPEYNNGTNYNEFVVFRSIEEAVVYGRAEIQKHDNLLTSSEQK